MLEICPTPNTTLNIPDSVNKLQSWYKNVFVDATVSFQLPYMQMRIALFNRDYTGFEPELLASYVSVLLELPNKLTVYENTYIYEAGYVPC